MCLSAFASMLYLIFANTVSIFAGKDFVSSASNVVKTVYRSKLNIVQGTKLSFRR